MRECGTGKANYWKGTEKLIVEENWRIYMEFYRTCNSNEANNPCIHLPNCTAPSNPQNLSSTRYSNIKPTLGTFKINFSSAESMPRIF